ncbi:ankyrin repeat domain-containing protein [Streptomyces sp. NPDC102274]|uniref:ankyrin repeat domain-containing protein n=1 Tax=Streptomyces sp. NPDC102274 TaxID=3366151 RepID=UPI0038286CC3
MVSAPSAQAEFEPGVIEVAASLFDLARQGDHDMLARCLEAGAPVNLTNDKGDTLLMLAAYHCHEQAVATLLEHGADTDRANDRGQTPLAAVVFHNDLAIVDRLLAAHADPRAGTRSALDMAVFFGRDDLASRWS